MVSHGFVKHLSSLSRPLPAFFDHSFDAILRVWRGNPLRVVRILYYAHKNFLWPYQNKLSASAQVLDLDQKMASVRKWLCELGLESYWGLLEGCGYSTVDSLR